MSASKPKTIIRLFAEEFQNYDMDLIAIKCNTEDYKVAYWFNRYLGLKLKKQAENILLKDTSGSSSYSNYFYNDQTNKVKWRLIENRSLQHAQVGENKYHPLFTTMIDEVGTASYLVPELKAFDFLLLIEETDCFFDVAPIIHQLQRIKSLSAIHEVDVNQLKSIDNLIF